VEEARVPEVEPLPPAYEEDENEEIGRPEGPLEERHIDPYAVEEEPAGRTRAASRMERRGGRSVEPGFILPAEPEAEDEWPVHLETEEEEPRGFEPVTAADEPGQEGEYAPESAQEPELDSGNASEPAGRSEGTPPDETGRAPLPTREELRFGRRPGRTKRGR